jgi:hypothetical protein
MAGEKLTDRFVRWPGVSDEYRNRVQATLTGMASGNLLENCFYSFRSSAEVFALESFFIKNDLAEAKNWFYVSALASMVAMERYGKDELSFSRALDFALLSDSKMLQERYARWRYPALEERLLKRMFMASNIRITQHLLLDEEREALAVFEAFLPNAGKKEYLRLAPDVLFLEGMVTGEQAKVETALTQLLDKKMVRYRNKDSIPGIGEWLSHPAMWYAKLAWIKGMEIQIDHPMVPLALLPVAPLPEYKSPWPCQS